MNVGASQKSSLEKMLLDVESSSMNIESTASISAVDALVFRNNNQEEEEEEDMSRFLVSKIIDKDSILESLNNNSSATFVPKPFVVRMHHAPRFGHSNRVGKLISSNPADAIDYTRGLKSFTWFILVPFGLWAILLLAFKLVYGVKKVGCAAGGEVLDMVELSKAGVSRKERRRRILRSWRLQTTFCIVGVFIPTVSMMMMEYGWKALHMGWTDVREVVNDAEALAFRGWNVVGSLHSVKDQLFQNALMKEVVEGNDELFVDWCPNAATSTEAMQALRDVVDSLQLNAEGLVRILEEHVPDKSNGFTVLMEATQDLDDSITWFFDHDWLLKLFLMILNVLNFLMVLACYVLSKNDIIHPPSQAYLSFLVVPLFSSTVVILLAILATSGIATLMNADFCAGGVDPGSPQGTIEDAILSYQFGSLERQQVTGKLGLVYDSFQYFSESCLIDNPLAFLDGISSEVNRAVEQMTKVSRTIPVDNEQTIAALNEECGGDLSFLPGTLDDLEIQLFSVQGNIKALTDLTSCHKISPIVRRITHGALCHESVDGLVWIWSCSLLICVLSFIVLTTRAALFNSVKRKKQRPKMSKRAVEKEFEEYKEFMAPYYDDAHKWQIQKVVEIDFGSQIQMNPTFETKSSDDEYDSSSEAAGINRPDDEYVSYGSSYESSEDSYADESDDGSQSAMTSFFAETKSIAMQTIHSIRSVRPLLSNIGKSFSRHADESIDDDSLYLSQSPGHASRRPERSKQHGLWRNITPTNKRVPFYARSKLLSALTPMAPRKGNSFLARTEAADDEESELHPINSPPKLKPSRVHPRKLKLSPFRSTKKSSRTTTTRPPRRHLSSVDASGEMTVHLDYMAKRHRNPYQRYGRTREDDSSASSFLHL